MSTDLSRLRATNDNHMDELHALRVSYGADLVSLIEHEPKYCGLAYRMENLSASFASYAFSVIHYSGATGYSEIDLNWTDTSGDETGFRLERSKTGQNFKQIASLPANTTRYRDANLDADTRYYYRARAVNSAGYSDYSDTASTTTDIAPAPSAPSNLNATATGTDRITLSWADNSDNESGFNVHRRPDGSSSWTQIGTTATDVTTYTDTGLPPATRYYYLVKAYNDSGQSGNSNSDSAQTYDLPVSKTYRQQDLLN
jgi:hypothetical protein